MPTGAIIAVPLVGSDCKVPTSPKQFAFVEVTMRLACELNAAWHSLLPRTDLGNMLCGNTSAAYAAEFDGRYFAVAMFSQPIIRQVMDGNTIELRRLAICQDAPKNTATRMLSVCLRMVKAKYPQMNKCVSYQAVDVHDGTIYRAGGWKPAGEVCKARPQRASGCRQRATGPLQTTSDKLRWEIAL
jgi:hypothetical protein